jgi:hypothetical protein
MASCGWRSSGEAFRASGLPNSGGYRDPSALSVSAIVQADLDKSSAGVPGTGLRRIWVRTRASNFVTCPDGRMNIIVRADFKSARHTFHIIGFVAIMTIGTDARALVGFEMGAEAQAVLVLPNSG